jgi:RNA polymerase sigma-70 factor (ECF subfamily)
MAGVDMEQGDREVSELIRAARAGDGEALERLLRRFRGYLGFLAREGIDTTVGIKADASDVVQDALLLAYRKFEQFRGGTEAELAAWLRRIVARSLAMLVRRYRGTAARDVRRERAIEGLLGRSSTALGRLLTARNGTPSQAVGKRERDVILADALEKLPEDHRRVLELRSFRGLEWEEVAKLMDRSSEAVRKLWGRAVKNLGLLIEGKEL